jgi:hypothetical protein
MTQMKAAPPAQLAQANLFDIGGPIRISFSASSITGQPLLSYADAELDLQFRGDEIDRVESPLGELVTVTLEDVPDAFLRTMTLVVPPIRLAPGQEVEFETFAVEAIDRSGAFVPAPGPAGVLVTYRTHELRGSAQHVDF